MDYFYLFVSVICMASSSILTTFFNRKNEDKKDASPLYNLINFCSVFIGWLLIFCFDYDFAWYVFLYSIGFGVCYAITTIGVINALKTGPIMLTALFLQLSLIGTTLWGFFFWDTNVSVKTILGILLVIISLWMCLYNGKGKQKISLRWLIFISMAFFGNAGCSIIQKTQQLASNGRYGSQLMLGATVISLIICFMVYIKSERKDTKLILKSSWYLPIISGGLNVVLNLFIIFLAVSKLSPAIIYPVIAVGGILITSLFSVFVFKEKLRYWQWIGVGIGTVAIVLLSI